MLHVVYTRLSSAVHERKPLSTQGAGRREERTQLRQRLVGRRTVLPGPRNGADARAERTDDADEMRRDLWTHLPSPGKAVRRYSSYGGERLTV